jgi:hypothetical protein
MENLITHIKNKIKSLKNEIHAIITMFIVIGVLVGICSITFKGGKYLYDGLGNNRQVTLSEKMELRQLSNNNYNENNSTGYFIFGVGHYHSTEKHYRVVKMLMLVGNSYRYFEVPLEKVRFNIVNTTTPYAKIAYHTYEYWGVREYENNSYLVNTFNSPHSSKTLYIYCSDIHLPLDLQPININN